MSENDLGLGAIHLKQTYRNRGAVAQLASALREGGMDAFQGGLAGLDAEANVRIHRESSRRLPPLIRKHWQAHHRQLLKLSEGLLECSDAELSGQAKPLLAALEQNWCCVPAAVGLGAWRMCIGRCWGRSLQRIPAVGRVAFR
jgi:exodeoxyribonuclease V alpha subunit